MIKEPPRLDVASEEELAHELAKRRAARSVKNVTEMEDMLEQSQAKELQESLLLYVQSQSGSEDAEDKPCPKCGKKVRVRAKGRIRKIRSVGGEIEFARNYHYCEDCSQGFYPLDQALGLLPQGELTPKMEARVLDFGVNAPYQEAAERWSVHHKSSISERLLRSVVERVGEQWEEKSPEQRQEQLCSKEGSASPLVVQVDGSMVSTRDLGWKEAKVAVLYREEHHVAGDKEVRGQMTEASYVATLSGLDSFREELSAALLAQKTEETQRVIFVADGAPVNWNLCEELIPWAVQILDFYHAMEHAMDCGKILYGEQGEGLSSWKEEIKNLLLEGSFEELESFLQSKLFGALASHQSALKKLLAYYRSHRARMDYKAYREQGFPLGSGAVESAHRHVIQSRMKRAGQHWEYERGDTMARLRAAYRTTGPADFYQTLKKAA